MFSVHLFAMYLVWRFYAIVWYFEMPVIIGRGQAKSYVDRVDWARKELLTQEVGRFSHYGHQDDYSFFSDFM